MTLPTTGDSTQGIDYIAVEESDTFQGLKRMQRSFVFPMAAFFLIWYFAYVLLAAFARDFMSQRARGDITVGLLMGLGQFVTTFIITMAYFSGSETSMIPGIDIAILPLNNPGIISIPLGFLLGWIGTVTAKTSESRALAAEMEVRSLTGYGAEKAVNH